MPVVEELTGEQQKEQDANTSHSNDFERRLSEAAIEYLDADPLEKPVKLITLISKGLAYLEQQGQIDLSSGQQDSSYIYTILTSELMNRFGVDLVTDFEVAQNTKNFLSDIYIVNTDGTNPQQLADPISMFSGEFVHEAIDASINGAGINFVFKRVYKNQSFLNGRLGFNWDDNYNLWLHVSHDKSAIFRGCGNLTRESYIRHPKFGQEGYSYYVPQDGCHGVIIENGNDSYIWRSPSGDRFLYRKDPGFDYKFRIERIQNKNGSLGDNDHSNFLDFKYSDDNLLQFIKINNSNRIVGFTYDEQGRIKVIKDYVNRKWRYTYDDFGDIVAVTSPATNRYPYGLTTRYEYSSSQFSLPSLQHNLIRIIDPASKTYLENEYGTDKGTLNFNKVIRQKQGRGDSYFEYEDVIHEFDQEYTDIERPRYQTNVMERNGHFVHYIYNRFGNLLLREEKILQNGVRRLVRWRYRHNVDGMLIAVRTPEGRITQSYYGREEYLRLNNITDNDLKNNPDIIFDNLTAKARMSFGNLLAIVKRGRFFNFSPSDLDLSNGVWGNFFPSILEEDQENLDIITKFTYEHDFQQMLTSSDPRFTRSANPSATSTTSFPPETERYQGTLTKYTYKGSSTNPNLNLFLDRIDYPNTRLPDNGSLEEISQKFEFDEKGRLKTTIDPELIMKRFEYFDSSADVREGYLKRVIVDPAGLNLITEYLVNYVGIVTTIITPRAVGSPEGHFHTDFDINELNQTSKTVSSPPFSYEMRSFYDKNGRLERIERDILDQHISSSSGDVEIRTYSYDEQNNLVKESIGGSDPLSNITTRYKYNESDKLVKITRPEGNKISTEYDERLFVKHVTRGVGSPEVSVEQTMYDRDALKTQSVDGRKNITRYRYDPFNRLIKTTDAMGNVSCFDYDKIGNIVVERFFEKQPDGTYELLTRSEYEYDELNRRIIERRNLFPLPLSTRNTTEPEAEFLNSHGPGSLLVTLSSYDKKGRLRKTRNAKNQETKFEYDNSDRIIQVTDALQNTVNFSYDFDGNLIRKDMYELVTDPITGSVRNDVFSTLREFDELNRMKSMTDSLGNTTIYFYDSRNNPTMQSDPLRNVTLIGYDIYGRKSEEIIRITTTGLGDGPYFNDIKTKFDYDKNGNLISYIDANGNVTIQGYDQLDRKKLIIWPDSSTQEFDYDTNDNIISYKDNNGLKRIYNFDALNHMFFMNLDFSSLTSYANINQLSDFKEYRFDGLGRMKFQRNEYCQTLIKFDSLGRNLVESITFTTSVAPVARGVTIEREFDELGNLSQIIYSTGRKIRYHLDNLNRIKLIENIAKGIDYLGSEVLPNRYDILINEYRGLRKSKTRFGNGASVSYSYDENGQIIQIANSTRNDNNFLIIQQLYDGSGNMRFKNDITQTESRAEEYNYNSAYWITKIKERIVSQFDPTDFEPESSAQPLNTLNGQSQIDALIGSLTQDNINPTYTYDQVGNRLTGMQPGEPSTYMSNNQLNQYTQVDVNTLNYDLNGNLIIDDSKRYFYNFNNQLTQIDDLTSGRTLVRFFYDVQGRRILNLTDNQSTHFLMDGQSVIEELHNGSPFAQYVHEFGIDEICQIVAKDRNDNGGSEYWYHKDLVKSCRLLTNLGGQISGRYNYTPFGILENPELARPHNPFRYMGRKFDDLTGLYDFRTRTYSPILGRFLQRDKVWKANLYAFVDNNPLVFSDPFGRDKQSSSRSEFVKKYDSEKGHLFSRDDVKSTLESPRTSEGLSHDAQVVDLIEQYRAASQSPYEAWDRAREDYRPVRGAWSEITNKEHVLALRDAEHFLFRFWLASELGVPFYIPRTFFNAADDSWWNPPFPISVDVMQDIHDPNYNWLREHVIEKVKDVAPTTQSMYEWEKRGYEYGEYYALKSGRERKRPYKKETIWDILIKVHGPSYLNFPSRPPPGAEITFPKEPIPNDINLEWPVKVPTW